jgi:hypothetical protein
VCVGAVAPRGERGCWPDVRRCYQYIRAGQVCLQRNMAQVIDEGRSKTAYSIRFHGEPDQEKISLAFDANHLSNALGVGNPGMMGVHRITVNNVAVSHHNMVNGLSFFQV